MRKILFLLLVLVLVGFFIFRTVKNQVRRDLTQIVPYPTTSVIPTEALKTTKEIDKIQVAKSLFVPYWTLSDEKIDQEDYGQFLYFGIKPGNNGIDKSEIGLESISKFNDSVPEKAQKQLVIRMIDSETTFPILKDSAKQKAVIKDSIAIAEENGFSGIVLDLEISAVPFDSLIKQVNDFTSLFYEETKNKNLNFSLMFYGDSFYRIRPFDIKTLSKNADNFLIMAYDFSKSRGNPGPNFPLHGKEVYGYDMTGMSSDFLRYLPLDKTSVVFGLFGYDWEVDENGKAIGSGEPLTYQQIKNKFLGNCKFKDCSARRKNDSSETEITYTNDENKKHIVWFEDPESVKSKEAYLKARGINNFSTWAYSYF